MDSGSQADSKSPVASGLWAVSERSTEAEGHAICSYLHVQLRDEGVGVVDTGRRLAHHA